MNKRRLSHVVVVAAVVLAIARPVLADSVRDIKDLSFADRGTLPPETQVRVFGGKTITLADARRNHLALVASRRYAQSITADAMIETAYPGLGLKGGTSTSQTHGNIPLVAASGAPYPDDYEAACLAVKATVCIYFPAGVDWYGENSSNAPGDSLSTFDWQISQADCPGTGGTWEAAADGCFYAYPGTEQLQFVPLPTGFKTKASCSASSATTNLYGSLEKTVDPHGFVMAKYHADNSAWASSTVKTSAFAHSELCFVSVSQ